MEKEEEIIQDGDANITIVSDSKSAIDQIEKIRYSTSNQILKGKNGLILMQMGTVQR